MLIEEHSAVLPYAKGKETRLIDYFQQHIAASHNNLSFSHTQILHPCKVREMVTYSRVYCVNDAQTVKHHSKPTADDINVNSNEIKVVFISI